MKSLIKEWDQFTTIKEPPLFVFCFNAKAPDLDLPNVIFHQGLTPVSLIKQLKSKNPDHHITIIYDDLYGLLDTTNKDEKLSQIGLFCELSRHLQIR